MSKVDPRAVMVKALITSVVVFNPIYYLIKSLLLGMQMIVQTSIFANAQFEITQM